tara:strand:+ start:1925 stop:2302 length:378 start_codon:yes stop_codon:yes gene_type:complete
LNKVKIRLSYQRIVNSVHQDSSNPSLFLPFFSNDDQIGDNEWLLGNSPNVHGLKGINCFTTYDIQLPEPEGYTFVRWLSDPLLESFPVGDFPYYSKYINCQGQIPGAFSSDLLPIINITAIWQLD